jgi:hypothetical protein
MNISDDMKQYALKNANLAVRAIARQTDRLLTILTVLRYEECPEKLELFDKLTDTFQAQARALIDHQ